MSNDVMRKCCHGYKYEKCRFGCVLWGYTRTWRTHYIDDGKIYPKGHENHWRLWEITSSARDGFVQGKSGYDLYHKGKFVKHGKTVKELKLFVERKATPSQTQNPAD